MRKYEKILVSKLRNLPKPRKTCVSSLEWTLATSFNMLKSQKIDLKTNDRQMDICPSWWCSMHLYPWYLPVICPPPWKISPSNWSEGWRATATSGGHGANLTRPSRIFLALKPLVTWRFQVTRPGKRWHNYGKSPCLMDKSTINGHFQ